jgi:hypothetical protein
MSGQITRKRSASGGMIGRHAYQCWGPAVLHYERRPRTRLGDMDAEARNSDVTVRHPGQ